MKRGALFIQDYNIDYSPSILNVVDLVSRHARIDMFLRNVQMKRSPTLRRKTIRLIEIRVPYLPFKPVRVCMRRLKLFLLGHVRLAFLMTHSVTQVQTRFRSVGYDLLLAFDAAGLVLCNTIFPHAHPYYYSLELTLLAELHTLPLRTQALVIQEQQYIGAIVGLIIQSHHRYEVFAAEHRVSPALPHFFLPVTYRGVAMTGKSTFLAKKLGISQKARIVLHIGGIKPYFSCLPIAEVFCALPGYVLVFQGLHDLTEANKIRRLLRERKAQNIFILDKFYTDIAALEPILRSADIGLAWYDNINTNFFTTGFSSGKIAGYMKYGLPIIGTNFPSLHEAIVGAQAGVCIDHVREMPEALLTIEQHYTRFRDGARAEYERRYRFENYSQRLVDFLHVG
jgi:glycosyltransferase involved in cell wall biosynthesis